MGDESFCEQVILHAPDGGYCGAVYVHATEARFSLSVGTERTSYSLHGLSPADFAAVQEAMDRARDWQIALKWGVNTKATRP